MAKPPPAYPVPAVRPIPTHVVASDLVERLAGEEMGHAIVRQLPAREARFGEWPEGIDPRLTEALGRRGIVQPRSEERRVGKECLVSCRSRWSPYH